MFLNDKFYFLMFLFANAQIETGGCAGNCDNLNNKKCVRSHEWILFGLEDWVYKRTPKAFDKNNSKKNPK